VFDAQAESSRYQPLNSNRYSDSSPLHAQNLFPDSLSREKEFALERIVERAVIPSVQPTHQSPKPENLPLELPANRPAIPDLRPIIPSLPDLTPKHIVTQPTRTVTVTIGRIEVRAASPPPTLPRKSSSAPALMSLDEYLQSRVKGER
jgi:hypothetical protein